jgi:ribosomal protein S18 acetylase RimI-like enzyme
MTAMSPEQSPAIAIRAATPDDLEAVVALDERHTGLAKPAYWRDIFGRYVEPARPHRLFLAAEQEARMIGFIVGEVRAWEFGSPPCGWVFAINVEPRHREHGVATALMDEICLRFKALSVATVRTMLSRDDALNLAFFRSQGMTAGSYIQLEKALD